MSTGTEWLSFKTFCIVLFAAHGQRDTIATPRHIYSCVFLIASLVPGSDQLRNGVYTGICAVCGHRIRFRAIQDGSTSDTPIDPVKSVTFSVNGAQYEVPDVDPTASLNDWLKEQPSLKGTKHMCQEGGCGACIVALTRYDAREKEQVTLAINSVSAS